MAARQKHIPQRTCVGCHQVQAKRALLRIVRTPQGIELDPTGKKAGRGVYLHLDPDCWQKGINGAIARALKVELTPSDHQLLAECSATIKKEQTSGSQ